MGIVSSYDDFSPLEEVIVGYPFHLSYSDDVSTQLFFPNVPLDGSGPGLRSRGLASLSGDGPHARVREELWEDLAALVEVLEGQGVTVRQPELVTEPVPVRTPDWKAEAGHCMMVRDMVLVLGDEIIETSPLVRTRYFETNAYKPLLYEYFHAGARWTVAPRPRMRDGDFDFGYVLRNGWTPPVPARGDPEIMFDAPQVVRLGRDLIFNCSTENHRLGARWLQRHVGERHRVHPVVTGIDDHVDCVLIPLRPGTLLVHGDFDLSTVPASLTDWEVIRHRPEARDYDGRLGLPLMGSPAVYMNVLSLDEERVVVEESETGLISLLERHGFTPVPCPWRHGRLVGGGFHCMTLDVRRRGPLRDYLGSGASEELDDRLAEDLRDRTTATADARPAEEAVS